MASIGIVTSSFPRWAGDVAGCFVLEMAQSLVARGHRVEVVAPEPAANCAWQQGTPWLCGVGVYPAPYFRPRRFEQLFYGAGVPDNLAAKPHLAVLVPAALAGLYAAVRRRLQHWDAVVSHWLVPSALVGGLAAPARLPHLAIAHSGDVHLISSLPGAGAIAAFLAARATRLGFISAALREQFLLMLPERQRAVIGARTALTPMGINPPVVDCSLAAGERKRLGGGKFAVLFIGRLVEIKGLEVLIDALSGFDDATLWVAGDGPLRAALEARAAANNVDAEFFGTVSPCRRDRLLAACDALVVPSVILDNGRREGLPLALMEGMAAGKPVIATTTGGMPELIEHARSGLLVPPRDVAALGQALSRLRAYPEAGAALGAAARVDIEGRRWSRLIPRYEELLGFSST